MLTISIILDFVVVMIAVIVIAKVKKISMLHPIVFYLGYHLVTVTLRLISINTGSPTLFDDPVYRRAGYLPVSIEEISRAAFFSDIALIATLIGMLVAEHASANRELVASNLTEKKSHVPQVNPQFFLPLLWLTLVVGVFGLLLNSALPGVQGRLSDTLISSDWQGSSWIFITQMWVGLALIGFIYYYGAKPHLLLLLSVFLVFQLFQGFHRFRIILPAIEVMALYLIQRKLHWPPRWLVLASFAVIVIFPSSKEIGKLLQQGAPLSAYTDAVSKSYTGNDGSSMSEFVILDQFANGLTLIDNAGHYWYGSTYLALLTLPIPREWWPQKPGLADHLQEISTPYRNISRLGVVITLLGEAYLNFGVVGILLIPPVLMYFLTRYYHHFKKLPYSAPGVLMYVIVLSSLIQVFRDGLTSLVLFTLVMGMPLVAALYLQVLFPPRSMRYGNKPAYVEPKDTAYVNGLKQFLEEH